MGEKIVLYRNVIRKVSIKVLAIVIIIATCKIQISPQPHKHYAAKNELILAIKEVLANSKYLDWGRDKHDPTAKAHLFEIEIKGEKSWIVVRELADGTINLHSISDSENILNILKEKTD